MTHGRFIDRLASGPHFPRQQGGRFTALGVLAAAVLVASCGVTETRQWSQRSGFSSHSLTWVKASGDQTEGRLSLVEHLVPPGSASSWHVHHTEDESFYVVGGRIAVLWKAIKWVSLNDGGFASGPKGVPRAFRVEGDRPARILLLTNGPDFADFAREASDPVLTGGLLQPAPPDVGRLKAAAEKHGIEILGPPPIAALRPKRN